VNSREFFAELKRRNVYKVQLPTRPSNGFWRRSAIISLIKGVFVRRVGPGFTYLWIYGISLETGVCPVLAVAAL
jgi:hypothetical protein